jgi:hypothetical protein
MVLFTPLILLNWLLASILYLPVLAVLAAGYLLSTWWAWIIELPASYMNKDVIDWEDKFVEALIASIIAQALGGLLLSCIIFAAVQL